MTLQTTFALLRGHRACPRGYKKLARHLGGVQKYGADTPIALSAILESNGVADTAWCLRAVPVHQQQQARRTGSIFAAGCAQHVLPIYAARNPEDGRVSDCIEAVYRYWRGETGLAELAEHRNAAYDACDACAYDDGDTAYAAYAAAAAVAAACAYAGDDDDAAYDDAYAACAYAADAACAYAADAAAYDAGSAAALEQEQQWQKEQLVKLLQGDR